MMQLHTMPKRARTAVYDPLAEAFRAGQELYKVGLLTVVNRQRQAQRKQAVGWPAVGVTPNEEHFREGPARLVRYASASKAKGAPLLLVCSLINRPYILDLLPERSVVQRLLEAGREVWLLDWGTPEADATDRGLGYYALDLLPRAAEVVLKKSGSDGLHVLGYCMGGTLALMAMAAGRLAVRSLVAMAAPVDLHDDGLLSLWCRAPGFDAEALVESYGNAPPHLLQPAFKMLDPVGLATKLVHLEDKVGDDDFARFFLAMETWLEDSVAFPGRAFVEWVRLYRENSLVRGGYTLDGTSMDLARIRVPILSLVAEGDYITPPPSALALERAAPNAKHTVRRSPGGHIGLATSSAAQRTLWPSVATWLSEQDPNLTQVRKKPKARR